MKLKALSVIAISCLGFTMAAQANEVLLTVNKPAKVSYRVAHKNHRHQPVLSELQTMDVSSNVTIPVDLKNYDLAGVIIVSINGHNLPSSANRFDQGKQCSMATDKTKPTGALNLSLTDHQISCSTYGGIFG